MKTTLSLILIIISIGVNAQSYEHDINKCIQNIKPTTELNIEEAFEAYQDILIAQGILKNKSNKSIYALYDIFLNKESISPKQSLQNHTIAENFELFNRCFMQFTRDNSTAFSKTKIHDLYVLISNNTKPSTELIISEFKKIIALKDLKNDVYKYYTLYFFYSLNKFIIVDSEFSLSKPETASVISNTAKIEIENEVKNKLNTLLKNNTDITEIILYNNNSPKIAEIILYVTANAQMLDVMKIMEFAKSKNIKLTIEDPTDLKAENLTILNVFDRVKLYIKENGALEKFNISSNDSEQKIVSYYKIQVNSFEIAIDHSNRIYLSKDSVTHASLYKNGSIKLVEESGYTDKALETYKILINKVLAED